jgi:hypothetical protein
LTKELKKREEKAGRPKRYVYNYAPSDGDTFKVRIEFKKASVGKDEIIKILEEMLEKLRG